MNMIAYYRVSTGRQTLGVPAQRDAVLRFLGGVAPIAEYTEVESGGNNARPELARAIAHAKSAKATLCVAKLDRLSRDVRFMLELADTKLPVRFADMPELKLSGGSASDRLMLTQLASFAEFERRLISERTKAALRAKRDRGEKLGNPHLILATNEQRSAKARARAEQLRGTLSAYQAAGFSQRKTVEELNRAGVKAARGGSWTLSQLQRVLSYLDAPAAEAAAA